MQLNIEDMDRLNYLSVPELAPAGDKAAYVCKKASEDDRAFESRVVVIDLQGKELYTIENADLPRFSPDGSRLAFLSSRSGEEQIWLKDSSGERKLTELVHGVSDYIWAPDGSRLYFTAKLYDEELGHAFGEMTPEEKRRWQKKKDDEPIVVEELIYKLDETGLFDGGHFQLGCVELSGSARLLTSGSFDHVLPAAAPDGSVLYYYGRPYGSVHRLQPQLMALSPEGDKLPNLPEEPDSSWPCDPIPESDGVLVLPRETLTDDSMAPVPVSGKEVLLLSWIKTDDGYVLAPVLADAETHSKRPLFETECPVEEVNNAIVGRNMVGRETPAFRISGDGFRVYFTSVWMGEQHLYSYDLREKTFTALSSGCCSIQAFSGEAGGRIAVLKGTLTRPAELCILDVCSRSMSEPLTDANGWLEAYELPVPQALGIPSADGKATVHGWYIKPADMKDGDQVPVVLDIHGGPDCSYSANFWFEFQYLASRGLAAAYCDPRGSIGYGKAHHSGESAYGGEAACDLMSFLDAVCSLGFADRGHCGVTGGSYGGFMTNWLITNTNRFAAAVTQRTLSNLATSYGTGDMGFVTGKKPEPMSRMFRNRATGRATTVRLVDRIDTPLLILHGTGDYRCSFEQAEQLYIAMKDRRPSVPVRFVAFPGQNHGLTRSGQPWAQKAHLKEMADWFVRYLRDEPRLTAAQEGPAWKDPEHAPKASAAADPTSSNKEEQ